MYDIEKYNQSLLKEVPTPPNDDVELQDVAQSNLRRQQINAAAASEDDESDDDISSRMQPPWNRRYAAKEVLLADAV